MSFSTVMIWVAAIVLSYLVGSIPTGFIITRWVKGVDIRQYGSGNMGATNVMRVLGKGLGALTLVIDMMKGLIAVLLIAPFFGKGFGFVENLRLFCGIAAIFGHNWTCFLRFKGGKGVATSTGVFLGLAPIATVCLVAIWGLVAFLTRYVSAASIIAAMALPILLFVFDKPLEWVIVGFILSLIAIWKHRGNIKRLFAGTEHKIGEKVKIS